MTFDEDDYPYNTNMDYTYESRSKQQYMHSMPNLPQFLSHTDIANYSGPSQAPQALRGRSDKTQDHGWNLAPGTLTFEADFDQQLPSMVLRENGSDQNSSYIYPDFDMSIFDTIGVGTNTNGVFDFNHLDDTAVSSFNIMGPGEASEGSWLNPPILPEDGISQGKTTDGDFWLHS